MQTFEVTTVPDTVVPAYREPALWIAKFVVGVLVFGAVAGVILTKTFGEGRHERAQAAHNQVHTGMMWLDVLRVAESDPSMSLGCQEGASPSEPRCRRAFLSTTGRLGGDWGFTVEFGSDGRVSTVGDVDYVE